MERSESLSPGLVFWIYKYDRQDNLCQPLGKMSVMPTENLFALYL